MGYKKFYLSHTPIHLTKHTKFVVRRVPSATLGKNATDGLYLKYCSFGALIEASLMRHCHKKLFVVRSREMWCI